MINSFNYIKIIIFFPNAYIRYKIMLTIPVSFILAEKSFSELKLIKSYLK